MDDDVLYSEAHEMIRLANAKRWLARTLPAAIGMVLLCRAFEADATGWKPNVREGADIVMKDHRWPFWDAGTYYCLWYMSFVPSHPRLGSFYGGVNTRGPGKPPGMFMSYWGEVRPVHEGECFYPHGYGAEGASGGAHGDAVFLRPGAWYRFVMRIFPPTRDRDKQTYVGWWVKDIEKNEWHTHSIVSLPAPATGFKGNSGFVEALAPHHVHRAFERRLGYCRVNGKWHKADTVTTRGPKFFKLIEGGTVLRYDRSEPDSPAKEDTAFTTRQPDTPQLDPPAIEGATARVYGNQVAVKWGIPRSAAPQLGYKLEVFDNPRAKGDPVVTAEDNAPHILARRLDTPREAKSVRLTVRDIFDQETSATIPVEKAACWPAAKAGGPRPGLEYAYYEAPAKTEWVRLPDFAALKPVRQGRVTMLDDTVQEDRYRLFGLRYRGYLRAPADGLYVFSAGTCDGSRMSIDGKVIADDDGLHGVSAKQYPIALAKGLHSFELLYFKGPCRRHGGHANLANKISIGWEGPGFQFRRLTEDDFVCEDAGRPSLTLALKDAAPGRVLEDNLVEIRARASLGEHRITKVQLYAGRMLLATAKGADVEEPGDIAFKFLFPAGRNRIRARLWYDGRYSVDSDNVLDFETRECIEGPWKFIVLGHKYPIAARCKDGRASFMGEGFYVGYQKVSGDFTLTARIADIALTTRENGMHTANWIGLYTSNVGRQGKGRGLESTFNQWGFGIYLTAGQGMRGSSDHPDLAGSRMCIASFPKDHRWLRIIRRGKRFLSFTSADGKIWQKAMEEISRSFTDEQYAGVCFRAVPGKGRALFQGALDHMTLERGNVPEEIREKPDKHDLSLDNRVTALVQAWKDPDVLYARTSGNGLLKSEDRGETWRAVNGGLGAPDALAVRSVAVHPADSSIALRGSGSVVDGTLRSGLWRSADGGNTWKLVTRELDFDGRGPTSVFGEVIAFCPQDPNLVAAAGETKGLFLSRDAGETWTCAGLTGERVTCLGFYPEKGKKPVLVVGTFADREFETLGLGKPASPLGAPGRIYWIQFRDGKPRIGKCCEVEDFGVTNVGFGAHENFATFATTRGVYYTWQRGNMVWQRRHDVPADRLFTALGYRQFMKEWRKDDWRLKSTTYAAPFSGKGPSPVYCCPERTTRKWFRLSDAARIERERGAPRLSEGVSCVLPDKDEARTLYLCNRHGILKTTDLGRTYRLVYRSPVK